MTAAALEPADLARLTRHVGVEEIPASEDLLSPEMLEEQLISDHDRGFDLLVGGDIMLGGRTRPFLDDQGAGYPFDGCLLVALTVARTQVIGPKIRCVPGDVVAVFVIDDARVV